MKIDKQKQKADKEAERSNMCPRDERDNMDDDMIAVVKNAAPPTDLDGLSYRELQAKAKQLGLKASGSKSDILGRLQ